MCVCVYVCMCVCVCMCVYVCVTDGQEQANFLSSDVLLLSAWAQQTGLPIVSINYSLAPEARFPCQLREVVASYKWLLAGRLGFVPASIIVIGDSIGGNLAAGLCLMCMDEHLPLPCHLIMCYPSLDLRPVLSPSRLLFQMDPFAPSGLLQQFRTMYIPPQSDVSRDAFLSPLLASDAQLAQFPPTSILAAGLDPMVDDSILMAHRLADQGVPVKLQYCPELPHSFFNFFMVLPEVQRAVQLVAEWATAAASASGRGTKP
jgi:acetyl esterase/lipase